MTMARWRRHLWLYGPTYGSAVLLCVIVGSLVNCNIMACESDIRKPASPMSCPERACSRVKPLLSTISESAMPGNKIGGKALLATCMTMMAALFVPYVRAMDNILRGVCPEAASGTGNTVQVCPMGCYVSSATSILRSMRRVGYSGCIFLTLTGLVGVQDGKAVHAIFAFIFFLLCGLYMRMFNAVLCDIYVATDLAHEHGSPLAAKTADKYDWLQKSLRLKRWSTAVFWFAFLAPWAGWCTCKLCMKQGDASVQMVVNMFSVSQWISVMALLTWCSSLNVELARAQQLPQPTAKSADDKVVVQRTDLSAVLE